MSYTMTEEIMRLAKNRRRYLLAIARQRGLSGWKAPHIKLVALQIMDEKYGKPNPDSLAGYLRNLYIKTIPTFKPYYIKKQVSAIKS